MRSFLLVAALVSGGWVAPSGAAAQALPVPISLEVGAGAMVPLDDWNVSDRDAGLRTSAGFAVSGALRVAFTERVSAYTSYEHAVPGCDDCMAFTLDERMRDHGFGVGMGLELLSLPSVAVRADAGAAIRQLGFRGGGELRSSDWGVGFEGRITGSWALTDALFLEPSVGIGGYPARFVFEDGAEREIEVRFLAPRAGLRYRF